MDYKRKQNGKVNYYGVLAGHRCSGSIAALLLYVSIFKRFFLFLNGLVLSLEESTRAGTSFVFGYIGGGTPPFFIKDPWIIFHTGLPGASFSVGDRCSLIPFLLLENPAVYCQGVFAGAAKDSEHRWCIRAWGFDYDFFGHGRIPPCYKTVFAGNDKERDFLSDGMRNGMYSRNSNGFIFNPSDRSHPRSVGKYFDCLLYSYRCSHHDLTHHDSGVRKTDKRNFYPERQEAKSAMDAIAKGTINALYLLLNIVAMLIVMVALVHLVNVMLGLLPAVAGRAVTLQRLLGFVMAPVVWLFGIPWAEAQTAGYLMGTKTMLNELLAFIDLANLPVEALSPRSRLIMTYALSSFANFGSLGILIGGLGSMVPERSSEIVGLGIKSLVAGTLATCMTGAV